MKKKVVVIGAGLGGLSSGLILAKNGFDVTILEKNWQIGGCLQCFTRKGVKFETGMHFIGSAEKGQVLYNLLNYLGVYNDIQLRKLDEDGYEVIALKDKKYKYVNGRENFINEMCKHFPSQRENLERYADRVEAVVNSSTIHTLEAKSSLVGVDQSSQLVSINEMIDQYITDETLKNVLVGSLPLYAPVKDRTPFSIHAFIMNFYNSSAYRIVGGSDRLSFALVDKLKSHGATIVTKSEATEILFDDKQAIGVKDQNGVVYPADYVISAVHPGVFAKMLDTPLMRRSYKERLQEIPNTIGVFSMYLHFKDGAVPYMNHNFYSYPDGNPWEAGDYTDETWPKGYLYMHFCSKMDETFARAGVVLSYMNMKDVEQWAGTTVEHRGQAYKEFKERKAQDLLAALDKDFPGIKDNIEDYYTSTPLTYVDYTGTLEGSMYGIMHDVTNPALCHVSQKTRVPNVLLTGQNINSHGILGVLVGSVATCSEIVPTETLYSQIQQTNEQ